MSAMHNYKYRHCVTSTQRLISIENVLGITKQAKTRLNKAMLNK